VVFYVLWPMVLPAGTTWAIFTHSLIWALPVLLAIALGRRWSERRLLPPMQAGIAAGGGMTLLIAIAATVRIARGWQQPIAESPRDVITALVTVVLVGFAGWLTAALVAERRARDADEAAAYEYTDGWDPELYALGVTGGPEEFNDADE
jgi:UDP-N-acetylmuramyl pentapeptide phosphotransferase/UDP-N-acetylglucosamine-1-phosphate transferase